MHDQAARAAYESRRGTAAFRGYDAHWRKIRDAVLRRDPFCQWGSQPTDHGFTLYDCRERSTDVAHLVPRSQRGTDTLSNLRGLCHAHHSAETSQRESWNGTTPLPFCYCNSHRHPRAAHPLADCLVEACDCQVGRARKARP